MFESILDCPKCKKRFHFEFENGAFPAIIACPECGEESPAAEFHVLLLCHQCHCKLKVPVSIIKDEGNLCPKCGAGIRNDFLDTMNNDALTVTGAAGEEGAARMLQDGDFFDKFRIIRFLGRGGMAEVYLAEHLLLKQTCALKLMRRNLDQDDNPVFIKRFVREAKLTHSLEHPNIVRVFDAGSDFKTGYLFLAMEYVEGDTLLEIMKRKGLTAAELLELLVVIAGALKRLEEAKIVHRDIKPSNIMYTREGVYKLMDLGIAKVESDHQAGDMTLTMEKSTIGTPGYASPEQCRAAHEVDIRSDIFSLGATLYHAATGFSPFGGETPVAVILNMMQSEPEPIREFREDLPDELIAIIEKMMKKDPKARFQNIGELLEAAQKVDPEKNGRSPIRKIGSALVNWTAGVANQTTLFREPRKNKDESAGRRIFKGALKTAAVLFLVLLSALHLYYVFDAMSGKSRYGSYGKFLKSLLFKTEEKVVNDFFMLNPLIPDPKLPVWSRQKGALAVRVEKHFYRKRSFNLTAEGVHGLSPEMFRDGVLHIDDSSKRTSPGTLLSPFSNWVCTLNFKLHSDKDMGILWIDNVELLIYNGTLHLISWGRYYADTGIVIPPHHWMNLAVMLNREEGRITLLSENRLLGSYLYSKKGVSTSSTAVQFRSEFLNKSMDGEVDFLAWSNKICNFQLEQPERRMALALHTERLKDLLPHEYSSNTRQSAVGNVNKNVAGRQGKKTQSLKNDTGTALSQKINVQKEHKVQENRDRNFRPRQSVRVQENKVQHKSEAYFPVLMPEKREAFPRVQTVDEHLALLRKEHRAYAEAVRKFQDSLKNMPETVPPGVRQKRRDIARLAAELCQMREKRFIYLEQRRQLVNAAKNRHYDDAAGKRVQKAVAQFVSSKRKTVEEEKEFGNRLFKLLSDPAVDPNIKVRSVPGKDIERPIFGAVTTGDLGFQVKCLEPLIRRGADPGGALLPHYTVIIQRITDYGLTGENLDNFFYFYQGAERGRLTTLFLDGAFPRPGSLGRCLKTKDYERLLFHLACGADPNRSVYGEDMPLFQTYKMAGGEKFRELLLAAGADPALTDRKGKRASDYALVGEFAESWEKEDLTAIQKALHSGAISPDHKLENGYNLLGSACLRGNEMLVKMLLEHGVDLRRTGSYGVTPLWALTRFVMKSEQRSADSEKAGRIMLLLLEKGVDFSHVDRNVSREASVMQYVLDYFPNRNHLIPHLVKYLDKLEDRQWPGVIRASLGRVLPRGNGGVATLTSGNLKLIINKCPGRVVREKIERLAQIRDLPGELLKKGFEAGLDPNIRIPARVYHRNRWQTAQYPLLWHLVENRSISAIGAALKAGADQERIDHTGVSLREKIKRLRTGGPSDRSPRRTYRR